MLLPRAVPYVSGEVQVFDQLVSAGEERTSVTLPNWLHHYLVVCISGHLRDPDLFDQTLAIMFLEARPLSRWARTDELRRSGDTSLILAGLFPERATRLHVSAGYFRLMGETSYACLARHLSATGSEDLGQLYSEIATSFPVLERVLAATRRTDDEWVAVRDLLVRQQ